MQVHNEQHKTYKDIQAVITANRVNNEKFFDKHTMHSFSTRVHNKLHYGCMFITSERERYNHDPRFNTRKYNARIIDENGTIWCVGPFMVHDYAYQAEKDIENYAKEMGWK